jgi:hypothetical protein
VSVEELMLRLVKKHSNCLQFYASDAAASLKPCIYFFPNVLPVVATYNNQDYEDFMSAVLQTMRDIMLPILLRTTVKGKCLFSGSHLCPLSPEVNLVLKKPKEGLQVCSHSFIRSDERITMKGVYIMLSNFILL